MTKIGNCAEADPDENLMENLKEEKKHIRREILNKRDALTIMDQERAEVLITERILGHQWFYLSDVILGFASYGSEIRTWEILTESLRKKKKLYLPKVMEDKMQFFRVEALEELQRGYKGIWEPSGEGEAYAYQPEEAKRTLLIMPGVAFDPYGNRMGYGKGFYDRFLEDKEGLQIRSIGIGHACQRVEKVPTGSFDVKPYQVILV